MPVSKGPAGLASGLAATRVSKGLAATRVSKGLAVVLSDLAGMLVSNGRAVMRDSKDLAETPVSNGRAELASGPAARLEFSGPAAMALECGGLKVASRVAEKVRRPINSTTFSVVRVSAG